MNHMPFSFYPVRDTQQIKAKQDNITYTTTDSFLKLCEIQEMALNQMPKPDFTAALRSEELKGKLFALYSDKKEKETQPMDSLPQILVEFIDKQEQELIQSSSSQSMNIQQDKPYLISPDTSDNNYPYSIDYI